jgi:hypothetical protein
LIFARYLRRVTRLLEEADVMFEFVRVVRVPSLFLVLVSGCQCDIPFSETVKLTLEMEVGGSSSCEFGPDDTLDANGDAVTDGDFGEVHYNYSHDGTSPPPTDPADPGFPTQCTVHVVNWTGNLADMKKLKEDIDAGVSKQGLDPEKATVKIDSVAFANVTLEVKTADDADFPLDPVGPYNAHLAVANADVRVEDAIVIENAGTGPVLKEHVTTSKNTGDLAKVFEGAISEGKNVTGLGTSDVQFIFTDLDELTDGGEGAPRMIITIDAQIDGALAASL